MRFQTDGAHVLLRAIRSAKPKHAAAGQYLRRSGIVNSLLIVLPILAVAFAIVYGVFRSLGRIWIDYKVRLALLERIQETPELAESFQDLRGLVLTKNAVRQNYPLTGVLLGLIGLGCVLAGKVLRVGQLAVGIYSGGLICIGLGVLLALAGIALQWFSRNPALPPPKK
jgi:hypothetical protein